MPEIKPEQLLLIAGFILPGAISMYVYGLVVLLLRPSDYALLRVYEGAEV